MSTPEATSTPPIDRACGVPVPPLRQFLAPAHWPVWFSIGLLWILAWCPCRLQRRLAQGLGTLGWLVAARDRHTTQVNLALCLPELAARTRDQLARAHFASLVQSLFETAALWFRPQGRLARSAQLAGREFLEAALARGKGVLLVTAHFTTNEMAAAALGQAGFAADLMYKRSRRPLIQAFALRRRLAQAPTGTRLVPSDAVVEVLRSLKRNRIVLYAPDQVYGGPGFLTEPFFGIPALCNPGISSLARATGCTVLLYFPERLSAAEDSTTPADRLTGYFQGRVLAPLPYFPSNDAAADVRRYHRAIEEQIRRAPEQYLWSYKRFRPLPGEPDPYRDQRPRGAA
jgi:KDO2-lipid IV(A) lauroyltransferase